MNLSEIFGFSVNTVDAEEAPGPRKSVYMYKVRDTNINRAQMQRHNHQHDTVNEGKRKQCVGD